MTIPLSLAFGLLLAQHQGHGVTQPHEDHAPSAQQQQDHAAPAQPEGTGPAVPPDRAEVTIEPGRQQLIGLTTAVAEVRRIGGTIRASGIVTSDETRTAEIHPRLMGWIETLYAKAEGQRITRGAPLYSLYSQELFAAQQEYLRALRSNPGLAAAARTRLELWDVPADQIARIEKQGPQRAILFRSPIAGVVLEKSVFEGTFVGPEMTLFRIADLSRVWIRASVYEFEIDRIDREGVARVQIQGVTHPAAARIDYVYPTVDRTSRTVQVRLVAPNEDGSLRPGSFAIVEFPTRPFEGVVVPEEAIVDTGVRQLVYLSLGNGRFRPVEVDVGRRGEGLAEIRRGIEAGDVVVKSALFLLDSESRLRGSSQPAGHGGH